MEEIHLRGIAKRLVLGMPLNSKYEALIRPLDRLDDSILKMDGAHP
jgi:hypothetical protein